jgi:hypothetical protein
VFLSLGLETDTGNLYRSSISSHINSSDASSKKFNDHTFCGFNPFPLDDCDLKAVAGGPLIAF